MAKNEAARPSAPPEEASFEDALERLERIVEDLEGGSLTLEQSIARYEEGVQLSKRLTQTLDQAEKRIERLVESESANAPVTSPMDIELGGEPDVSDSSPSWEDPPAGVEKRGAGGRDARRAPSRESRPPAARSTGPDELPF